MAINNQNFDYEACDFSEKNMYSKDKGDNLSKEGSGRVSLYKATGVKHCYTLEVNYNSGRIKNNFFPYHNSKICYDCMIHI